MAQTRPFMTTGVALVGAAAIAAGPSIVTTASPTPTALSTAQYNLTALADITIEGITTALASGWGGFIGPDDIFYPNTFNNDVKLTGVNGVAYYLADQGLAGIVPNNLENYFFEVGSQSTSNTVLAGLGAVAYVGVGSAFGVDSVPAQLVKAITTGSFDLSNINIGDILGGIDLANLAPTVLALTAGIPVIGPLASVYITGMAPGDETVYGTGLAGVVAYAQTALPGISDLFNGIGKADDETESDEVDDADETEAEDDDEKDGDYHGKPKSAAAVSVVSDTPPVVEETDSAPAVSAPVAEPDVNVSDAKTESAAPKRAVHRGAVAAAAVTAVEKGVGAAADNKSDASTRTKRTANRPARNN